MCGFAALFEKDRVFQGNLLAEIDRDLFHRGPDSGKIHQAPGHAVVFRRLSIIDPEARSDQPMLDHTGQYVLVFNGEIYNFKSLRNDLIAAGVELRTKGDAEVIVEGYARWGEDIANRLEGMFAFAIYDLKEQSVFAARDPYGIKPLYMVQKGGFLGLASEAKPLRRATGYNSVDESALSELLMFRFAAGRHSNLKGIELLPGGTCLTFHAHEGVVRERRFCDPLDTLVPDPSIGHNQAVEMAEQAISDSIEVHLQSDVGYAIQLSGGVDSSLVLALATQKSGRKLDSYGVRLPEVEYDESPYRAMVVERFGSRHMEVDLGGRNFADALPRAVGAMEGPVPHFGCVMLMLLCERIKDRHKVVLTGEGADEFFGGYERYARWRELRLHGRVGKMIPDSLFENLFKRYIYLRRFKRFDAAVLSGVYFDFTKLHNIFPGLIPKPGAREAASSRFSDFRDKMLAVDQTNYLSSLLMRQDKMAMAAGVEARVPFTHYPLARLVNRIPRELRVPGGTTKPLLKTIAERYLPEKLVYRRKVGLNLPLSDWLRDETGLGRFLELLTAPDCHLAQYAKPGALVRLVDDFRTKDSQPGMPVLANLINLELWMRSLSAKL